MNKNLLNKNLFLFLLITAISIGGIIVFAKNNMTQSNQDKNSTVFNNDTQTTQNTNNADVQFNQNNDINNYEVKPMDENNSQATNPTASPTQAPGSASVTQVTELKARDIVVGSGQEVKSGDTVEVNYLGTFLNGQKFDSSYDRNDTFEFTVGAGQVIRGWDAGVVGMKVGGKRELLIPADLAYGATGVPGAIPPNTPLRFEIELVAIK